QSDRARTSARPDHGGESEGQSAELAAPWRRFVLAHRSGSGRGELQLHNLFHDQSEPVRPRQVAQGFNPASAAPAGTHVTVWRIAEVAAAGPQSLYLQASPVV